MIRTIDNKQGNSERTQTSSSPISYLSRIKLNNILWDRRLCTVCCLFFCLLLLLRFRHLTLVWTKERKGHWRALTFLVLSLSTFQLAYGHYHPFLSSWFYLHRTNILIRAAKKKYLCAHMERKALDRYICGSIIWLNIICSCSRSSDVFFSSSVHFIKISFRACA